MKRNICIVEVVARRRLHFWPHDYWADRDAGTVEIDAWPRALARRFKGVGLYSIQRVPKGTRGTVSVGVRGLPYDTWNEGTPAEWLDLGGHPYYVCRRFLNFIGVKAPEAACSRRFYLKVTKI